VSGGWLQRDELRDCGFELVELERFAQENGIRPKRPHLVLNPVVLERRDDDDRRRQAGGSAAAAQVDRYR
jgi:hypothetical protein